MASGHDDKSVRCWKFITIEQKPYLQLMWSTHQNALSCQDANLEGVVGLSTDNVALLKQRGAIGDPLSLEAAKLIQLNETSYVSNKAEKDSVSAVSVAPLIFSSAGNSRKESEIGVIENAANQSKQEEDRHKALELEDHSKKKVCCVIL